MAKLPKSILKIYIDRKKAEVIGLVPEDICEIERSIKKGGGFAVWIPVVIEGQNGEIAYVRDDTDYSSHELNIKLVTEFPLGLKSYSNDPRAKWVRDAFKFFQPRFASHEEEVKKGDEFKSLLDPSLPTLESYDPVDKQWYVKRMRSLSDRGDHGGKKKWQNFVKKQHKAIHDKFQECLKSGMNDDLCASKVRKLFDSHPLWEKNRNFSAIFKISDFIHGYPPNDLIEALEDDRYKVPPRGSYVKRLNDLLKSRSFSNELLKRCKNNTLLESGKTVIQLKMDKGKKKTLTSFEIRKILQAIYPDQTPEMEFNPMEDSTIKRIGRSKM